MIAWNIPYAFQIDAENAHRPDTVVPGNFLRTALKMLNVDGLGQTLSNVAVSTAADFGHIHRS